MTRIDAEHLDACTDESKQKLAQLASTVFGQKEEDLTKEQILTLVKMEMAAIPSKLYVNVDEVRRTKLQYCTWKGGMSAEIDMADLKEVARRIVEFDINPVEGFIKASSYIKAFMASKLERTEDMLRLQMNRTIKKDNLEIIPDTRFDGKVI